MPDSEAASRSAASEGRKRSPRGHPIVKQSAAVELRTSAKTVVALAVDVSCSSDALSVTLFDGRVVSVPMVWFPRLAGASARERFDWELIGGGIGIHWEAIDEDISVASLLRPENFMRLPSQALPLASRERLMRKKSRTPPANHRRSEGGRKRA